MKRKSYNSRFQNLVYNRIADFIKGLFKLLYHIEVYGIENIPLNGAAIIAPNHRSSLDVFTLAVSIPRPIKALGKIERFKYPIWGRFAQYLGGIPVKRACTDVSAVRDALEVIRRGEILLIFPEGTRLGDEKIEVAPKRGIGYFAAKTNVPVIPTTVVGAEKIWPPGKRIPHLKGKVKVIFHRPLYFAGIPDKETEEFFTQRIMGVINKSVSEELTK
ncbi:MAG: lysophospholipid acyltransferase family protein [Dictyoglomaceae bacterium]|nr:lysophospholipid acyltransferase family protein [Dictyoglomaceae bacterium]HPU42901.1 lysophospholipid acyltransferase family protein [Dictyoglomaceae bacterium]